MDNQISTAIEFPKNEIKKQVKWTREEDNLLLEIAKNYNYREWNLIAKQIPGRTSKQCNLRYLQIKPGLSRGMWKEDEDNLLLEYHKVYGNDWRSISKKLKTRNSKQIRDRFINYLDSSAHTRSNFTDQEEHKLIELYPMFRHAWKKYVKYFPNRTALMVKGHFLGKLNWLVKKYKRKRYNKNMIVDNDEKDNNHLNEVQREDEYEDGIRKTINNLYITNEVELTLKRKRSRKKWINIDTYDNHLLLEKIDQYDFQPTFDLLGSKYKSYKILETNIYQTMVNLLQLQLNATKNKSCIDKEIDCIMKIMDLTYLKYNMIKNKKNTDLMIINNK